MSQIQFDSKEEFIQLCREKYGDKYDYSQIIYKDSVTPILIKCSEHGEFSQVPVSHYLSRQEPCHKCRPKISHKPRLSSEEYVKLLEEKYGDEYDYSLVEYKRNNIPITITCKKHNNTYEVFPAYFLHTSAKSKGCRICASENIKPHNKGKFSTTEEFVKKAKRVHGDRYDYSKVEYIASKYKVCIICKEHGEFWQNCTLHLRGSNCPKCVKIRIADEKRKTTEQFIEEAKSIHGDKYDYSKVEYTGNSDKVTIICSEGHEFSQAPGSHLKGQGCRYCSNLKNTPTIKDLPVDHKRCKVCLEVKHKDKFGEASRHQNLAYNKKTTCIYCEEKQRQERETIKEEKRKARELEKLNGTKICKVCGEAKGFTEFVNGLTCRECTNTQRRDKWKNLSPEEKQKKYDKSVRNILKKAKEDPQFRLIRNCRNRIRWAVKNQNTSKADQIVKLLGITAKGLHEYLTNKGYNAKIHEIDHVLPLSRFDLTDGRVQKVAFNYRNLQPMIKNKNTRKGIKLIDGWEIFLEKICKELEENYEYIKERFRV